MEHDACVVLISEGDSEKNEVSLDCEKVEVSGS